MTTRLERILDRDGFAAALQFIVRNGVPLNRRVQLALLKGVERQFKNAKRLAKKHADPRIAKLERLAANRGATEGERAAARAAAERLRGLPYPRPESLEAFIARHRALRGR
jgi:hypothetical protein